MVDAVRVNNHLAIPPAEFDFRFSRSGGPGGQNVNKRDTRVELIFNVGRSPSLGPRQRAWILERLANRIDAEGRLRIVASRQRTQAANREEAVQRLGQVLSDALKVREPRRPTRPSAAARERRLEAKRARARIKSSRGALSRHEE